MGPSAAILLNREPSEADHATLHDILRRIGDVPANQTDGLDAWISDTNAIGGNYRGEGRPCWVSWQLGECYPGEYEDPPNWRGLIEQHFAFVMRARLDLSAGVNRADDHRVLGELALHLCRTFEGLIDFRGALLPYDGRDPLISADWRDAAESARELLQSLPGPVLPIQYSTGERTWARHVGDCRFLAAWLQHPAFFMIK